LATRNLTKDDFETTVVHNDIVLVDFWAEWCGPCKMFGPIYEDAASQHDDIVFGKVDTEEQRELAAHFGIRSIPTLMVFRDQVMVFQQAGALPRESLESLITQVKDLDMDEVRKQIDDHAHDHAH